MAELRKYILEFLKVLTDPTRLDILFLIRKSEKNSSEIQKELGKSQSTISKHLNLLINKNLVDFEKKDNINYYKIKNNEIFTLLSNINSIVVSANRELFKDLRDVDIYNTLS